MFEKILESIRNKELFDKDYLETIDIDEILDLRDEEHFDSNWMRVYNDLQRIELKEEKKIEINKILEETFLLIYEFSKDGELAGEVSDDFEIICKAYISSYDDEWLNSLIMSYIKKEIPCGILEPSGSSLLECVSILCDLSDV